MSENAELIKLFKNVLGLCNVREGETFAVLTEERAFEAYASAYLVAAQDLGAQAFQLNLAKRLPPPGAKTRTTSLSGNAAAVEVLKSADILIDLVGLLWSAEQKKIQEGGTRILMCREPVDIITRMFPTKELRRRVEAAETRLKQAKELRITSKAGTDVTYRLGRYPVLTQYGYTDQPGRWDNLPGGFLYTGAHDDGVNGTVVINAGDMLFPFKRYMSNPIHLSIEGGRVVRIDGDNVDAEMLRTYMRRWNDPRAYAVSHIGWGMDEKAQWDFLGTSPLAGQSTGADGRAFYGNVLFSTGPNSELGGANDTGCHLDIPLRGCDLSLDGEVIVEGGELVPPEMRVGS
jgi:2,5-dihydroxypyridine 5,6-dioxygenase